MMPDTHLVERARHRAPARRPSERPGRRRNAAPAPNHELAMLVPLSGLLGELGHIEAIDARGVPDEGLVDIVLRLPIRTERPENAQTATRRLIWSNRPTSTRIVWHRRCSTAAIGSAKLAWGP